MVQKVRVVVPVQVIEAVAGVKIQKRLLTKLRELFIIYIAT